jgi:hypothetical protein
MARRSNNQPQNSYTATDWKNTGRREFGVAGIADNICKENIVGFQPICERIRTLRMKKNKKINKKN